jgi:chromosome segregation ATPase
MRTWVVGLLCCGLLMAAAPAALGQAGDDAAIQEAKRKYEALCKEYDALRKEMGAFRSKHDKDAEVTVARKAADAARKAYDESLKTSAGVAEAKKAGDEARKKLTAEIELAVAADAEAGPVLKKYQDATKRLAALKEEIKALTTEQRKLRSELSAHQRRVSRNKEVGKDARAAVSAAGKAYADAVKKDAAVQAAKAAADDARDKYGKLRQAKMTADPAYGTLMQKAKDLDKQMRALRDQMRPRRGR